MDYLPDDYIYKIIENSEKSFIFRIKNVSDKETALAWLSAYEKKSKFTWRKSRTYPNAGKIYVFHEDYRCHHNTDNRIRHQRNESIKRISKHTGCEATLKIKVKKYVKKSKSQCPDVDAKEYPCIVIMGEKHNHSQFSAEVLRFRDIAEVTKKKLLHYFQKGFSASFAHHALEAELQLNEENFESAKSDASLLPSVSVIQHLFKRKFSAANSTRDSNPDSPDCTRDSNPDSPDCTRDSNPDKSDCTRDGNPKKLGIKRKKSDVKGVKKKKKTSQLHEDNEKLLLAELKHDVILKIGNTELHAHQEVLRAQSPVFKSMLSHDMMKNNSVIIEMYDCDPEAMEQFLLFVYTGKVKRLDQTNMLNLYYIADKYDMEHLKTECRDFIKKSLSVTNICDVIKFAWSHSDSILLDNVTEYFGNNVLDILRSMEWQSFLKDNSAAANDLLIKYFEKPKT